MNIQEVRKIAKTWGIDAKARRKKEDIIRDIQISEGYSPCFRTKDICIEYECLWKRDCINNKSNNNSLKPMS
ncbi:MAG: hypothetical protein ABFD82_15420 [Syntrophaceae bacterium]